jgi:Protein of unknown function (DUF4233)
MRSPRRTLAAATVSLEAFVVFFAGLVAKDLSSLTTGAALAVFGGLAIACLLTARLLRRPWGYTVGWVVQGAAVATGFWVPVMFFLGALFAVLWFVALQQGARIEREQQEYAAGASTLPPSGS